MRWLCGAALLALGLAAGCGGDPGLNLVPVEGTVTLDGEPLKNKSLMFVPADPGGTRAGGNTDSNGKYKLIAVVSGVTEDQVGVPPGQYKVTVFEPLIPIEAEPGTDDEFYEPVFVPGQEQSGIPPAYQSDATTPLVVDVPEEGGTLNLELVSRPG